MNRAAIIFPLLFALSTIAHAYDVTLAWDPNDEPDLAGYIVYVKDVSFDPSYYQLDTVSLDELEPDNPMYAATDLKENLQYCFVVTAYDSEGFESGYSNEVCVLNGQEIVSETVQASGGGGGGGGCFISISSD